jgi:hypothetical protein
MGMCAIFAAVSAAACGERPRSSHDGIRDGVEQPSGPEGSGGVGGGAGGAGAGGEGGAAQVASGDTIFASFYGDEGQQSMGGLASDDAGNVYVVGYERQSGVELGPTQGVMNGSFVVKYSPTGSLRWRQPFPQEAGSSDSLLLLSVGLQPTTGAVILAGRLTGTFTFEDGTTVTSSLNQFGVHEMNLVLVAIDTAGYFVWARLYPSPAFVEPDRVFVTANGDIEVYGRASNNATVGGAPICCLNSQFGTNTFLARYSPSGDPVWTTAITGGDFFLVAGDADADGGMVIGGGLIGSMTFDGQTFTGGGPVPGQGANASAGVVLRTDPQGRLRWSRLFDGPAQPTSQIGTALDRSGNVVLFGQFAGTLDLGGGHVLEHTGSGGAALERAGMLAKLDPDGATLWARGFPADGFETVTPRAASTDAAGNIALAGLTAGGLSLGGGAPPLPDGARGDFVAKYNPDGSWLWDRGFAVETGNSGSGRFGLDFDGAGRLGVAAEFDGTSDFGTGPVTAPGQPTSSGGSAFPRVPDNIFILKLAP